MNAIQKCGRMTGGKSWARLLGAVFLLLWGGQTMVSAAPTLSATWYGTVSTDWNNATNWTPSWQIPGSIQQVPASVTSVTIPSGCPYYPTLTNSQTISGLTMNQSAGSVTVAGGTLTVNTGNIDALSGSTFTINAGASVICTNGVIAGGVWTVNGSLTAPVTIYNTATFTINTGATVNSSTGGLNLNANGGTLNIYGTFNDGNNAIADNANVLVSGGSLTAGTITLNAGGLTVTSSTLTAGGFIFYNGGNLTVSGSSTVSSSGSWAFDGGGYTISSGNFTFSGGTMTLPSGTFTSLSLTNSGTYTLVSGTSITGNLGIASGAKASVGSGVNISAGSLSLAGAGQASGTWGSSSSSAANKNSTYFTGSGLVTVTNSTNLKTTTTTLGALTSSTYGRSIVFTATIAPAPGGGTVQFETNGVALGSPVTVSSSTASYTNSTLAAGSYPITAVYAGTTGYSGSTSGTSTQVVNTATVTITSGLTAANKVYNHNTSTTLNSNNLVLSGVLPGDAANVHVSLNTYTATFAQSGVGNNIPVTVASLALVGSAQANYSLTQPTGLTANITVAPVTVTSGVTANNKTYDGTTTATFSTNSVVLSGVLNDDRNSVALVTNGYAANFAGAGVANGIAVTVNGLTLAGSAATNYSLSQPTGLTANITAATATIASGLTANNKPYDGTTTAMISSNSVVLGGIAAGDSANVHVSTNGYTAGFASAGVANGMAVTVGGLTLTGSAATNYSLTQPTGLTANITATAVTIASGVTVNNKIYNGTTTATISTNAVVLSGVLAGDAANIALSTNGYTAAFISAGAANGKSVSVSGLTLTGSAATNYSLTQPTGLTANIATATATVTAGVTANNKTYDGTTTAGISTNTVVFSGVLAADAANVKLATNGYTASFMSVGVANGITVTVSGLSLTGSAATNYSLTQPTGLTANITAAAVTVASGVTANGKVYDGSTTATISTTSVVLSGVAAGDAGNVVLSTNGYTATFATAGTGTGKSVTVGGLSLTGSAAGNYTLTQPTGLTANITVAPVTVAGGVTANNKIYNGNTSATLSTNAVILSGVVTGDTGSVRLDTNGYAASFTSASVGNVIAVTVSGLGLTGSAATNYSLTQPTGLTANITAATVLITSGVTANSKVYDGTTTTGISSNNVVFNGLVAADAANVKLSTNGYTATFASANVGNGIMVTVGGLTLTGSAAGNYTLTQPTGLTANITALSVTVASGVTANNKAYDGSTAATISTGTVVLSGVRAGDMGNVALSTSNYTATFASAGAGNGKSVTVSGLSLTGSAAANYTLVQPTVLTANITQDTVTVAGGLTANNKVYNGTTAAALSSGSVELSGVLTTDMANVKLSTNGYTAAFVSPGVANGITVTVSGLSLTGSAATNYSLTQPTSLTANITAALVTVTAGLTGNSKIYDGTTTTTISSNNVALGGVLAGDTAGVALSTNGYAATFTTATTGTGKTVTVSGLTLTGGAATNYTLTQPVLTGDIKTAPVTIAAGITANNKAFDGTTAATISSNNVVLSGVLAGDTAAVALSTNHYTATFISSAPGQGVNVTVGRLTLIGSAATNYSLTQPTGLTANITQVTLTITSPVNQQEVATNNPTITVTGTAAADLPLTGVWLKLNSGGWTNAATSNGWTNWSEVVPVAAGTQVLSAYAVDTTGHYSLTNTVAFMLYHTQKMVVDTNGDGTVWTNFNTLTLDIGKTYTMLATARGGWTFTNWTSNLLPANNPVLTNNNNLIFTMQSNLVLTANFVDWSRPTLTMSVLASGLKTVTNQSPLTVTGTVSNAPDGSTVTGVWVSFNSNVWQSVTSANNWTNWSTLISPEPGTQSVRAYATDSVGNYSLTNTFTFTYVQTFPLVVGTNQVGTGQGGISPNYNGQGLQLGTRYSMTATAKAGSKFTSWTSNLLPATNAATITFTMASNLMLYANFLDITPPTNTVTSPVNGQVVTNSTYTIQGVASDNVAVAQVWYEANSNGWQLATGTNNWSGSVTLSAGTNVLRAFALDTAGNASPTNTLRVLYAQTGILTLQTNGLGSISNIAGTYVIGQTYSLTAAAAAGFTFTNWTASTGPGTNKATLTFTMTPELVLTANFVDAQAPSVKIVGPLAARLTNSQVTITGTATDNWRVGAVYCQLNGGGWTLVNTSNGYTNWTWTINLAPGTNVINAQAADLGYLQPNGLPRYSATNSTLEYFLTAPYSLRNFSALVTPDDGTPPFEMDFGSNVFSQYAWGTNDNAAGTYTYANPGVATGVLSLQATALPEKMYEQTIQLNFTNYYVANFSYTNGNGQTVNASAVFSAITNIAPATLVGQTLMKVTGLGTVETTSFYTNGVAVQISGASRQINNWTLQTYGPRGAVIVFTSGGETNWDLLHMETVYASEYDNESSTGSEDIGLTGFVRTIGGGDAPAAAALNGAGLVANSGTTLTAIDLAATQFTLITSDNSFAGAGTYTYSQPNSNTGQFIFNYTGGGTVTNTVQFVDPSFGVMTNNAVVSGVIVN